jgi:hypothetical protein
MEKARFNCEKCSYSAVKLCHWKEHILTKKHIKQAVPDEINNCEICYVKCSHKSVLDRHIKTKKHIEAVKKSGISENKYIEVINQLVLDNQRTTKDNDELRNFIIEQSKIIEKVLDKNTEVVSRAIDIAKTNNNTTIIQTNNNTTQKFNINVFLNETCKDAMNFSDFIKNIKISYQDLENNAQLGFVGGISKIFLDNLKQLDISERPIHCTDVKREIMYIKDDNEWTKQIDDTKLQNAIQTISYRSLGKLTEWKQENPDYKDCNSDFSNKCVVIQRSIIAGYERSVYYPKVIHALARECSGFSNKKGVNKAEP